MAETGLNPPHRKFVDCGSVTPPLDFSTFGVWIARSFVGAKISVALAVSLGRRGVGTPIKVVRVSDKPALDIGRPALLTTTESCLPLYSSRFHVVSVLPGFQMGVNVEYYMFAAGRLAMTAASLHVCLKLQCLMIP